MILPFSKYIISDSKRKTYYSIPVPNESLPESLESPINISFDAQFEFATLSFTHLSLTHQSS